MAETNTSDTITRLTLGTREIILLGTAHVSQESIVEVDRVIREEKPGRVCVEIDDGRYRSLTEGQNWSKLNISQIIQKFKEQ